MGGESAARNKTKSCSDFPNQNTVKSGGKRNRKSIGGVRKNLIPTLNMPEKSSVGNPTTRMQVPISLIQNGCLVSGMGLILQLGIRPMSGRIQVMSTLKCRQKIEDSNQYETLWEKWDLYIPFIERSYKLLKPGGFTTLIVSDAYCHSKYAQKSQNWFLKNSRILRLDFLSKIKIFDAGVHNVTYLFQKADGSHQKPERRVHDPEVGAVTLLPTGEQCNLTYRTFFPEDTDLQQFLTPMVALSEICYISYGLRPSSNEKDS